MSKLYSVVAAYLPLFYCLLLSGVDCGIELRCHIETRPPVGRERRWTAGYAVGWPEVRGGVEVTATGAAADAQMSGGVPGTLGYVPGQSGLLYWWVLSWCVLSVTPFRMNSLSLVRWLLLYRSLLVSLLYHWLVGRADGRGFQKVVLLVRGHFLCLWK